MLVQLGNPIFRLPNILPTSYFSKAGLHSIAEQYLSLSSTYGTITKSVDQKYHLITIKNRSFNGLTTTLKIISYCTVILPLIAIIIKKITKENQSNNKYYADIYQGSLTKFPLQSRNLDSEHSKTVLNASVEELSALHKLDPDLLSKGSFFTKACKDNNYTLITRLFNAGGKNLLNQKNSAGLTPFEQACNDPNKELIRNLVSLGGKDILNQTNSIGLTPFEQACKDSNIDLIRQLILLGDNSLFNQKNPNGNTPFLQACKDSNTRLIRNLSVLGCAYLGKQELFNQTDDEGDTAFTDACITLRYDVISLLITCGGKELLNQFNKKNGRTVLVDAVFEGSSWEQIQKLNQATYLHLFKTISHSDLLKIKQKNATIYAKIIQDDVFHSNPNYSKHRLSTPSSNRSNSDLNDALKILFDGKKLIKTQKAITKAFRSMAAKHHPDKNGGTKKAHEAWLPIEAAYRLIQEEKNWENLPVE
ncbi:MAG: ankyrin repeat domain-containing protein [Chlamydiota bacterium]